MIKIQVKKINILYINKYTPMKKKIEVLYFFVKNYFIIFDRAFIFIYRMYIQHIICIDIILKCL